MVRAGVISVIVALAAVFAGAALAFCPSCYPPPASGCNERSEIGRVITYQSGRWECDDHYFIDRYGVLHVRIYWDWIGWA